MKAFILLILAIQSPLWHRMGVDIERQSSVAVRENMGLEGLIDADMFLELL